MLSDKLEVPPLALPAAGVFVTADGAEMEDELVSPDRIAGEHWPEAGHTKRVQIGELDCHKACGDTEGCRWEQCSVEMDKGEKDEKKVYSDAQLSHLWLIRHFMIGCLLLATVQEKYLWQSDQTGRRRCNSL